MESCHCDYELPRFYDARRVTARKQHKCEECCRPIWIGEQYERAAGMWPDDSAPRIFRTCVRCLSLRDYVQAHVPCLCWAHGNLIDDAMNAVDEYWHEAPGLRFGARRREVLIYRNKMPNL